MTVKTLIMGATGTVGAQVAAQMARRGLPYVCAGRGAAAGQHPSVALDFERPETFALALNDVQQVFLIAPGFRDDADGLLAPFIEALRRASVQHVVFSSVIGAEYNPSGVHRKIELILEAAGLRTTFLRPNFYMQNYLTYEGENVLGAGEIPLPTGEGRASYVDVLDIAEVAAEVLAAPDAHAGRAYTLTGPEAHSHGELAALLSAALGAPVRFSDPSPEDYRARLVSYGVPEAIIAQSEGLYALIRGSVCAATTDDVEAVLGRPPTPFAAWAQREAVPALRGRPGSEAPGPEALVSRANALMTAWELGDTEGYRSLCAPHVCMRIPQYGLEVSGFDGLWGVRASIRPLAEGPLHIHTLDTQVVRGREVSGQGHVIHRQTGAFTQHSVMRFSFDEGARLVDYHQVNIWPA